MTTLPAPITWYQFGEPTADHNENCGVNAVASVLVALGKLPADAQAPLTVDAWLQASGDPAIYGPVASVGTYGQELSDMLGHWAVHSVWTEIAFSELAAILGRGHYAIALVSSDGNGHPTPGTTIGHWVVVYSNDGAVYRIANSGSGVDETYDSGYFAACYRGVLVEALATVPAAQPPTPSQPSATTEDEDDMDIARAKHPTIVGRADYAWRAPDGTVHHEWVQGGVAQGSESLGGATTSSPRADWSDDGQTLRIRAIGTDGALYVATLPLNGPTPSQPWAKEG